MAASFFLLLIFLHYQCRDFLSFGRHRPKALHMLGLLFFLSLLRRYRSTFSAPSFSAPLKETLTKTY